MPPEVAKGLVGDAADAAIDSFKSKVREKAKSAILSGAQQVKAAAQNESEVPASAGTTTSTSG